VSSRPEVGDPAGEVLVDLAGGVATVTLNRPGRRNAVSWDLLVQLAAALEELAADEHVRVVVLTGSGRYFCVGADLARVGSSEVADQETRTLRGRSVQDDRDRLTRASRVVELLVGFPVPTVARVNGACAGAGLSLALATDFSIAARGAKVNTAFASAGVSGDLGSAWLLSRATGVARARALLLDPVKMTATEAVALGVFTEVVDDLDARVAQLARKLAGQSPLAMRHLKSNVLDAACLDLQGYLLREVPRMVETAGADTARDAARSFVDGRGGRA